MADTFDNNRRRHVRHEADIPVDVWLGDLVANNKEYLNISASAVCLSVPIRWFLKKQ